jgi:hypothetical protein
MNETTTQLCDLLDGLIQFGVVTFIGVGGYWPPNKKILSKDRKIRADRRKKEN